MLNDHEERSKRQPTKVYTFIAASINAKGMPPNIREIGRAMEIESTSHIDHILQAGLIERQKGISRGIKLTQSPETM